MKIDSMSTSGFANANTKAAVTKAAVTKAAVTKAAVTKAAVTKAAVTKAASNSKEYAQNSIAHSNSMQEIENKPKIELSLSEKQWMEIISKANKALEGPHTSVEFSIHAKTKEIMVKVIDKETNKVLREFPPEKILDLVAKMWEMVGIIVDERR